MRSINTKDYYEKLPGSKSVNNFCGFGTCVGCYFWNISVFRLACGWK